VEKFHAILKRDALISVFTGAWSLVLSVDGWNKSTPSHLISLRSLFLRLSLDPKGIFPCYRNIEFVCMLYSFLCLLHASPYLSCLIRSPSLIPWSRVLLEKLTCAQLVKKFLAFYGPRMFITAFIRACHLSLTCAISIQPIPAPSHFLKVYSGVIFPSNLITILTFYFCINYFVPVADTVLLLVRKGCLSVGWPVWSPRVPPQSQSEAVGYSTIVKSAIKASPISGHSAVHGCLNRNNTELYTRACCCYVQR